MTTSLQGVVSLKFPEDSFSQQDPLLRMHTSARKQQNTPAESRNSIFAQKKGKGNTLWHVGPRAKPPEQPFPGSEYNDSNSGFTENTPARSIYSH